MAAELAPGRWTLQSSENFDDYMKAIGVGLPTRLIVGKLKPDTEISIKDSVWTIKNLSTFKNAETSFKLNEPYKETTPDGRAVEVLCTVVGNKLIREEKGEIPVKAVRDFSKEQFTMTMEAKGVTCTRIYHKVASS